MSIFKKFIQPDKTKSERRGSIFTRIRRSSILQTTPPTPPNNAEDITEDSTTTQQQQQQQQNNEDNQHNKEQSIEEENTDNATTTTTIDTEVNTKENIQDYDIIHAGYLKKEGGFRKNWKKRWFILRSNKVLYYHEKKNVSKYKGFIELRNTTIKVIQRPKRPNCFQIYSKDFMRTYYICSPTQTDMDRWIKILRGVTEHGSGEMEPTAKVLILGNKGVGKTSLIRRWKDGIFSSESSSNQADTPYTDSTFSPMSPSSSLNNTPSNSFTPAAAPKRSSIEEENNTTSDKTTDGVLDDSFQLTSIRARTEDGIGCVIDVIRTERDDIRDFPDAYQSGIHSVVIAFDITNMKSFLDAQAFVDDVKQHYSEVLIILLGTKIDMVDMRVVSTMMGFSFAAQKHIEYMEATATSNQGDYSFSFIVDILSRRSIFKNV